MTAGFITVGALAVADPTAPAAELDLPVERMADWDAAALDRF